MKLTLTALAVGAMLAIAGCANLGMMGGGPRAIASLEATKGNSTGGRVEFEQQGSTVRVTATVTGLAPNQEHGFHLHEKADCSSGDGMSAGGHWNPDNTPHGPQNAAHHGGDMPNLKADAAGNAKAHYVLAGLTVAPGPKSVVGRGLIVHKDPDDYKTQPTGNAGARLACAVVRPA